MKKSVRLLLIAAGLLVLVLLVAGALAFNSGVQTWAARKALAGQPGLKGKLGQVSADLQTVALRDVQLEQEGAVITLPSLLAELSVIDAGLNQKISLRRLVAKGWTLDLTGYKFPAPLPKSAGSIALAAVPAAAAVQVFQGVFAQAALPFDLMLDGVELEGEVKLPPAPGLTSGRAHVVLTGGGLAAGREGAFTFNVTVALAGADVPVTSLAISGRLMAALDTPRTFARLATQAAAAATGPQFPNGVKLAADISAARASSGENYFLSLSDGVRLLGSLKAELPFASRHLTGAWKLDLRDSDLSPFSLGQALPVFALAGDGSLDVETTTTEVRATGKILASADKLGVIQSQLAQLGAVKLTAEFDLARRGDSLRVERLTAAFVGAQPIATVQSLQAFEFNPKSGELKVADTARDLLGLSLQGLPLAWTQPLLQDLVLSGGDLQGEFIAMARNGGFALRSKSPLTAAGVSVTRGGTPLVAGVDLSLSASADYTPQGWQAEFSPLSLVSGSRALFSLEARAGQLRGSGQPVKATGKFSLNLPGALSQPVMAGILELTTGTATGEFITSLGVKQEIQVKLTLTNLATDPKFTTQKLPMLSADLRADVAANGSIALSFPLFIERDGRKSDLTLVGTITPGKNALAVDATVTSARLVIEDAQILSAAFAPGSAAPATVAGSAPARDTSPPWAGLSGQVGLALKQVIYSDIFQLTDVTGNVSLTAGGAKLVNFRAGLGEGAEARVNGALTFDVKSSTPFGLSADLAVKEFDPSVLFKTLNPGRPATVEGKFSVASKLSGRAASLGELATSTHGDFQLASKGGVFRGLPVNYMAKVETAGKIAAGAAAIGNLLGSVTGKKDYADLATRAQAVSEISKTLTAIPYDQLNVVFTRDEAMNHALKDFSLIAPELRLSGVGQTHGQPGTGLLAQSLSMEFKLRARGRTADVLKYLGKLEATTDDLGYAGCTLPLKIAGTIGQPDTSDLNRAIANLALEKSGVTDKASELLNKLIGGGK